MISLRVLDFIVSNYVNCKLQLIQYSTSHSVKFTNDIILF